MFGVHPQILPDPPAKKGTTLQQYDSNEQDKEYSKRWARGRRLSLMANPASKHEATFPLKLAMSCPAVPFFVPVRHCEDLT